MKVPAKRSNQVLTSSLLFVVFWLGFFAHDIYAQTCQRRQPECTYNVQGYFCDTDLCNPHFCLGSTHVCCYYEYGWCVDNPQNRANSQICGGLCGGPVS